MGNYITIAKIDLNSFTVSWAKKIPVISQTGIMAVGNHVFISFKSSQNTYLVKMNKDTGDFILT